MKINDILASIRYKGAIALKKMFKTSIVAVIICLMTLCAFNSFGANYFDEYEYSSTIHHFYQIEDYDWMEETHFYVKLDQYSMVAKIEQYESEAQDVVIPEYFEYDDERYTVVEIADGDIYNNWQSSIYIPETVTKIAPSSVGFCKREVEVWVPDIDEYGNDYGYWDWEYRLMPIEGFLIKCVKGSEAERYANENGFICEAYENISNAEIVLDASEFTFSGREIEPEFQVILNESSLVKNVDYEVSFSSNVSVGTATVTVSGMGNYKGTVETTFEIVPADVSLLKISAVSAQYYTGGSLKPDVKITMGDIILTRNIDYKITYKNNVYPGKASMTVTFEGNYKGKKTISFKIQLKPMSGVTVTAISSTEVKISWNEIPCDQYRIYLYNTKTQKYTILKKTTSNSYTHTKRTQLTTYKYAVKAVVNADGETLANKYVEKSVTTLPTTPTIKLYTKNKAVKVQWNKNTKADGYQVYRIVNWGYEFERVKTIKDKNATSWTNTGLNNDYDYFYIVRSFKKVDGKYVYSEFSEQKYSSSSESRLNAATLNPKKSFKVYNAQGSKSYLAWTATLSKNDIKILDKFAKKYFNSKMTRDEVLEITLRWINENVKYATGNDYYKIANLSYVEAIFSKKQGQCLQYNGAMASMMAYLGYNVRLIQGYRGNGYSKWQHFWVEAVISGRTYVFETGNYGRDGSWSYFCKTYKETNNGYSWYIKNGKAMG